MTIFTESIWDRVKGHTWKFRARSRGVDGLLWHTTRGGQMYPGWKEYQAAVNWFTSPNNIIRDPRFDPYAGISHVLIGPEHICEVVPIDHYIPAFSSHPSDEHAISIEVCQSNVGQPIDAATIANCRKFAAWASNRYGFPLGRVMPKSDIGWTGEAGHEDTQQGGNQGKSDPGPVFWEMYLKEDDAMSAADKARLDRLERLLAGWGIDVDGERITGEAALKLADERQWSAFLGIGQTRQFAADHAKLPHNVVPPGREATIVFK